MKAGLAAGLAALEAFAAADRTGNLLFVAVPDEEVNSLGARELARAISAIEASHAIEIIAAINLDAIADDGDGTQGRSISLGSVGKLLLTAFVVGQSSHACYPLAGLNAGALAGAIAAEVEWSPDLADAVGGEAGMPPTLLSLKDGKSHYDVTTPGTAFATWNTLTLARGADEILARFRGVVGRAVDDAIARLARRRGAVGDPTSMPRVEILDADALVREVTGAPSDTAAYAAEAERLAGEGLDLPEQCRRLTEWAWRRSGRRGPAVVLGFGSLPYPPVRLSDGSSARRLLAAVEASRQAAEAISGSSLRTIAFFPGISDMSFLGEAQTEGLSVVAANTPAWQSGVRWAGEVGAIPTVNIGPWGRDYHTPLERLHLPFAFEVLPHLVFDVAVRTLEGKA
jgi:arginine utilization protein RocB